jgi:hypothetical protein
MAEAFRVDPEALAEAVDHMSEFQRYTESMLSEIDSLVSNCTPHGPVKPPRRMSRRTGIGAKVRR